MAEGCTVCDVCGAPGTQGSSTPIPASWTVCERCADEGCMPYSVAVDLALKARARKDLDFGLGMCVGRTLSALGTRQAEFWADLKFHEAAGDFHRLVTND